MKSASDQTEDNKLAPQDTSWVSFADLLMVSKRLHFCLHASVVLNGRRDQSGPSKGRMSDSLKDSHGKPSFSVTYTSLQVFL